MKYQITPIFMIVSSLVAFPNLGMGMEIIHQTLQIDLVRNL